MIDFIPVLEIAGTILLITVPIIVISWALAGSDGASLADIFAIPAGPPLPRGVQEEEPVRYRVERLSRPRNAAERSERAAADAPPAVSTRVAAGGRPAVDAGGCS